MRITTHQRMAAAATPADDVRPRPGGRRPAPTLGGRAVVDDAGDPAGKGAGTDGGDEISLALLKNARIDPRWASGIAVGVPDTSIRILFFHQIYP